MLDEIVASLSRDYGVHPYAKWQGAHWRLASLVETQWPDGGWNCDRHPESTHSSFNETWAPTMGLAAYARETGHDGARAGADRAAEFLLQHSVYQSHRTGEPAHPAFTRLRWPPYWHYDALVGLVTLKRSVGLDDPRTSDALDLVESRRREDGTWRSEGEWWKGPGPKGGNVEVVDWGQTAHEMLTAGAREVLTAARRS